MSLNSPLIHFLHPTHLTSLARLTHFILTHSTHPIHSAQLLASFTHHSSAHSLTHSPHSLTHPLPHSLTRSLAHSGSSLLHLFLPSKASHVGSSGHLIFCPPARWGCLDFMCGVGSLILSTSDFEQPLRRMCVPAKTLTFCIFRNSQKRTARKQERTSGRQLPTASFRARLA